MDSINNNDIIQELHKLCRVVLPEKATWSIDEIHTHIYSNKSIDKSQSFKTLKNELKRLEVKGAVVLIDEYRSIKLVTPRLSELLADTISKI